MTTQHTTVWNVSGCKTTYYTKKQAVFSVHCALSNILIFQSEHFQLLPHKGTMPVFIVIQCASNSSTKYSISAWSKLCSRPRCQPRNKVSTPAISNFPNTSAFTLSHTVSCFHAHLEARPGCLNSLNDITCGSSRGVTSPPPRIKKSCGKKHSTCNF